MGKWCFDHHFDSNSISPAELDGTLDSDCHGVCLLYRLNQVCLGRIDVLEYAHLLILPAVNEALYFSNGWHFNIWNLFILHRVNWLVPRGIGLIGSSF